MINFYASINSIHQRVYFYDTKVNEFTNSLFIQINYIICSILKLLLNALLLDVDDQASNYMTLYVLF